MRSPSLTKTSRLEAGIVGAAYIAWTCALTAVLLSYAYVGSFSRYVSDDFQTAGFARSLGFWNSQLYWYQNWSGRFSFVFTINFVQKFLGTHVVPLLAMGAIVLWIVALAWLIFQASALLGRKVSTSISLFVAQLMVVVTLAINGAPGETLYWETGLVTYTLPIIMFVMLIGTFVYSIRNTQRPSISLIVLTGFATAFLGGFSETFAAFQTAFFGMAFLSGSVSLHKDARWVRRLIVAGFLGAVVAICIVTSAPGNQIRMEQAPKPAMAWVFESAFLYPFYLIYKFLYVTPFNAAMAFVLPAAVGFCTASQLPRDSRFALHRSLKFLFANVVFLILMAACTVPSFYALSSSGPARVLLLPQLLMVIAVTGWGYLVGVSIRTAPATLMAAITLSLLAVVSVLVVVPINMVRANLQSLPIANRYAREWDLQDQEIRKAKASGVNEIKVPAGGISLYGACGLSTDPHYWYNEAVANYYGVKSIAAPNSTLKSCE